ncbi:MAG TPA: YciI family protein [Steroidobacteraceae bacterium]|nr:YciI family protein [Steroidobacteraceae bacterium]
MYVLNISYSQPLSKVEPHMVKHSEWVRQHLERGTFLAAGPKKSGLGGIILGKSMPKPELQALLAGDAFVTADVADYQISEFDCRLTAADLHSLSGL